MARKELCFVIMPFHEKFDPVWSAIKKAGSRFKYLNVERNDTQDPGAKKIFQNIKEKIKRAAFVFSDISKDPKYNSIMINPNVLIETGYAMGLQKDVYLLGQSPIKAKDIPSDISQHSIMSYDLSDIEDLDDWFEAKIEKIMLSHKIDTERLVQRRETQAEKLNWLIKVVRQLREKAKDNYTSEQWKIGNLQFMPDSCYISLSYKPEVPIEEGVRGYDVKCGVFFKEWKRRTTPFRIQVNKAGDRAESKLYEVEIEDPLDSVPTEKVLDRFEEELDKILTQISNISTLTPLANSLSIMEEIRNDLINLESEGFTTVQARQKQFTKISSQRLKTKSHRWRKDGFEVPGLVKKDNSPLKLCIDFHHWEEEKGRRDVSRLL